jgi:hypothetical protein
VVHKLIAEQQMTSRPGVSGLNPEKYNKISAERKNKSFDDN